MHHRSFLLLLFALTLASSTCNRNEQPFFPIVDESNLLTPEQEQALADRINAHEAKTTNEIAVWLTDLFEGDAMDVAMEKGNALGVGKEGKDNGVMIAICVPCRQGVIATGYGTETVLHDSTAHRFLYDVIFPHCASGDVFQGLMNGVDSIANYLEQPGREIPIKN